MSTTPDATTDEPTTTTCQNGMEGCSGTDDCFPCYECSKRCVADYEWCEGPISVAWGGTQCLDCIVKAGAMSGTSQ